jgi:hypothetical protein
VTTVRLELEFIQMPEGFLKLSNLKCLGEAKMSVFKQFPT